MDKSWSVSFDITPISIDTSTKDQYTNILHLTNGENVSRIYFAPNSFQLQFSAAINGKQHYYINEKNLTSGITTKIVVRQRYSNNYYYQIIIDGNVVHDTTNTDARTFENVEIYSDNSMYPPAFAFINNLNIGKVSHLLLLS